MHCLLGIGTEISELRVLESSSVKKLFFANIQKNLRAGWKTLQPTHADPPETNGSRALPRT